MESKLGSIKKLKAMKEREEISSLGKIQALLNNEMDKLDMLIDYRDKYTDDYVSERGGYSSSQSLMAQHHFFSNLDVAIDQQKGQIKLTENKLTQQMDRWKLANQELKAIENYMQKQSDIALLEQSKREQKIVDDLIQNRFHLNRL